MPILSLLCVAFALACAAPAFAQDILRVGAYPANPPWEHKNEAGAFEVVVVNDIAARLGTTAEFSGLSFDALFVAAAWRRVDMVISSLTITGERLQSQSFTQPYVAAALGIATKKGTGIASIEDLKGRRVGSIAASLPDIWVEERKAEVQLGSYYSSCNCIANLLSDLRSGRIETAVNDVIGLRHGMTQMLDITIEVPTDERFAIMMADAISAMKTDGTMARVHEKWFGVAPAAGSLTLTPLPIPTE